MEVVKKLKIHGKVITCKINRSKKRKTLSYSLSYGQIRILTPYSLTEVKMIEFIESTLPKERVERIVTEDLIGEDYIYILGRKRRLVVLSEGQNASSLDDVIVSSREDLDKYINSFALNLFKDRVKKYESIMKSPYTHQVMIKNLKGAYGKNYLLTHKIVLEKRMIHFSLDIIDQTVIHEICHDFEANHSSRFYNILRSYCPYYKDLKDKLSLGVRR